MNVTTPKRQIQNAPGQLLNISYLAMRNKLKRAKTNADPWCRGKEPLTPIVLSDDETPGKDSVLPAEKHTHVSHSEGKPLQEKTRPRCAKDVKIAAIFLRKGKVNRKGGLVQPVEKLHKSLLPPQSDDSKSRFSPSVCDPSEKRRSWRGQVSPSALLGCLEEIQASNPAFPVRTVFGSLQKKEFTSSGNRFYLQQNRLKEKRKRGNESSPMPPKRLRTSPITEGTVGASSPPLSAQSVQDSAVLSPMKQPRSSRLSRTHNLKQQRSESVGLLNKKSNPEWTNPTESDNQSLTICDIFQRNSGFEDVLWTDKYSPLCSSEVIGNSASVNKLHSWLKKWKLRADCEERRKNEERKREENSSNLWDRGDFQGEAGTEGDRVEPLCNTMLITGPSGVGKTASVYACAQELCFKVFEVNCSSVRSGRHVLSQLKEATQSHLVETSGTHPLKPAYFSNYSTKSCSHNSENVPGKAAAPKNVISMLKKRPAQTRGRKGNANPAALTLPKCFKMKAKADHLHFGGPSSSEEPESKKLNISSPGCDQTLPQNKKTATSLILFEEVDVVFEDDVGFLAAVKAFMSTTKRPVVLTANDPSFRERFGCSLEEIIFKAPSALNVCSYLQLVCLAENMKLELKDVLGLLELTRGDVRRCLLQLQLWVNSGRRRASLNKEPTCLCDSDVEGGDRVDSQLDAGCTTSMLGLHPASLNHLLNLLKSRTDPDALLKLLAESWRRNVPLLYANLDLLLASASVQPGELAPSEVQLDENVNSRATAANSNSIRNISRLSRRKYASAVFDVTSSSNLTQKPQKATCLRATRPAADCLDALTDFFDLMSYLDATMLAAEPVITASCRPEFIWTGAEMKDGLLDEMTDEEGRGFCQESLLDTQAAAEGLGFCRCWRRASESWTEAQRHRQELGVLSFGKQETLPVSAKQESLRFGFQPLCAPNLSQRRYKLSRAVLGSQSFSLLGNRRAVAVDYMPVLRSICRSQKQQQQRAEPGRCLHYLSSIHLGLSKSTLQVLSEDF